MSLESSADRVNDEMARAPASVDGLGADQAEEKDPTFVGITLLAELRRHGATITVYTDPFRVVVERPAGQGIPQRLMELARVRPRDLLEALRYERLATDPRQDLEEDTIYWMRLLHCTYRYDSEKPGGLHMTLHGFRCLGAALVWVEQDGHRFLMLRPGEISLAEYRQERPRLLPHAAAMQRLLRTMTREFSAPPGSGMTPLSPEVTRLVIEGRDAIEVSMAVQRVLQDTMAGWGIGQGRPEGDHA